MGYSEIYKEFLKNEEKAEKDKGFQIILKEVKKREAILPGTVPSIKRIIIEIIKAENIKGVDYVQLQTIYEEAEKIVESKDLHYKMDTFRNSIRGELNKHELNSEHQDNMSLFIRSSKQRGHYSLTEKAKIYEGR